MQTGWRHDPQDGTPFDILQGKVNPMRDWIYDDRVSLEGEIFATKQAQPGTVEFEHSHDTALACHV